jgi:uncharacterized protein (TIGR00369 family)
MSEALWVAKFLEQLPHGQALGIELVSVDPARGACVFRLPWRAELIGDPEQEILHGGVITALLDSLGAAATIARGLFMPATLDLRIDYLRPARAFSDLIAEAECYRVTRHVAFVRGLCHQGDAAHPVANLTATFMIGGRASEVLIAAEAGGGAGAGQR